MPKVTNHDDPHIPKLEKNWKPFHTTILKETAKGTTVKDISKKIDMSISTVTLVRRSKIFQDKLLKYNMKNNSSPKKEMTGYINKVQEDARSELYKKALVAAKTITKLMKSGTSHDRIKFDAAKEILHQCGIKPIEVVEHRERQYPPEEVESAKKTLIELKALIVRFDNKESPYVLSETSPSAQERKKTRSSVTEESSTSDEKQKEESFDTS